MAYLSDEERANLVAYLDGELEEQAAHALEARLSSDPRARAEAESLRRTWELLDYLPRTEASTSFTHRTLERLAVQTSSRPLALSRSRWRGKVLVLAWVAAVLLAVIGGLAAANWLWPAQRPEQPEVEALIVQSPRLLQFERLYQNADDLDFLRELDQPDLFGDDAGW
jgi:anti-sigma factor RsiW